MFRPFHILPCAVLALMLTAPLTGEAGADCSSTESWAGLGTGLSGKPIGSTELNGNLYVLHKTPPTQTDAQGAYQISMWDGSVWSSVTSFQLTPKNLALPYGSAMAIVQAYNGSLYMGGMFDAIDGNTSLGGIARWDGSAWKSLGSLSSGLTLHVITAMAVHNDKLIVAGQISDDEIFNRKVLQWDGTSWDYVGGEDSQKLNYSRVTSLVSWNNSLYLSGRELRMGDAYLSPIVRWDGYQWTSMVQLARIGAVSQLFIHNNEVYAAGEWTGQDGAANSPFAHWNGTDWITDIPWPRTAFPEVPHIASHDNQIYMISPEDREDLWGPAVIDRFDGSAWHLISDFNGEVSVLAPHKGKLFAGGDFTAFCGTPVANFATLDNTPSSVTDPAAGVAPALAIYPNPAASTLNLKGNLRNNALVTLRNMLGEEVARYHHDGSGHMTIDASALPAGTYLLEAEMANGVAVERISVVR